MQNRRLSGDRTEEGEKIANNFAKFAAATIINVCDANLSSVNR